MAKVWVGVHPVLMLLDSQKMGWTAACIPATGWLKYGLECSLYFSYWMARTWDRVQPVFLLLQYRTKKSAMAKKCPVFQRFLAVVYSVAFTV
jgi:hypothetical protein